MPLKCQRSTNASAVSDLASSIALMSLSGALETPQCCTAAIKVAVHDENLTREEHIQVLSLFRHDIAAADAYLAIDDEEICTECICAEL